MKSQLIRNDFKRGDKVRYIKGGESCYLDYTDVLEVCDSAFFYNGQVRVPVHHINEDGETVRLALPENDLERL